MPQGYERRDTPQTEQQVSPLQGGSVPLAPVSYPRPGSVGGVGKDLDNLRTLLEGASQLIAAYGKQEEEKDTMAGKLAFIQGKTEADIAKDGNRYTMAGFMSMQAKTAGTEWFQTKLLDIEKSDKSATPEQYREQILKDYSEVLDNTAGADAYTRKLMTSMADEFLPRLISQQIQSNNKWREDQTALAAQQMLVTDSNAPILEDPTGKTKIANLQGVLGYVKSILPEDRANSVIADALVLNYMQGNDALEKAASEHRVVGMEQAEAAAQIPPGITGYLLSKESGGHRYGKDGKVIQGPVVSPTGVAERAVGEWQVLPSTAKNPGFGVVGIQNDSPEEYARVGADYITALQKRYNGDGTLALMAYNGSYGSVDAHIAKVGDPTKGQISIQDFVASFPKAETRKYVADWVSGLSSVSQQYSTPQQQNAKVGLIQSLVDANFSAAEITRVINAREQFVTKRTQEFDANREMTEDAMLQDIRTNGNLPGYYESVQKYKETNSLTNEWANSMATRGRQEYQHYLKTQEETAKIQAAIATNSVANLSGDLKLRAIDLQAMQSQQRIAADESIPDDQKQDAAFKSQIKFLNRNALVDERIAKSIQGQLSGSVIDSKGVLSTDAISAYSKLRAISEIVGPHEAGLYAGTGQAGKLYEQALQLDIAGQGTASALMQAANMLARKDSGIPTQHANISEEQSIAVIQDKLPSFFPSISKWMFQRNSLVGGLDVRNSEENKLVNDNGLLGWVKTNALLMQDTTPGMEYSAAVSHVLRSNIGPHMEFVNGNVLWSSKGSSFYKDIGFTDQEVKQLGSFNNVMNFAVQTYLKENGQKLWSDLDFNAFNILGSTGSETAWLPMRAYNAVVGAPQTIATSIADKWRGFPEFHARWVSEGPNRGLIIDLYKNTTDLGQIVRNQPRFIPASDLKDIIAKGTIYRPQQKGGNLLDMGKDALESVYDYIGPAKGK